MQIYLLLTDNCNLNCSMCIRGKQDGTSIDFDTLKSLNFVNELSNHDIVITGGEPTLHADFCEIVKFMCHHAKTVTVTSNGTTDYFITDNFKNDNLFFQISLDGDEVTHDNIRGNGSFQKALSTIKKLDYMGFQYSVASVVSKKNVGSILCLADTLATFNNMRYWRISYEMPFGSANFSNIMTSTEWNDFVDCMIEHVNFRLKIQKIFPFDLYESRKAELDQLASKSSRCFNCGSGKNKIYVYPDFNVYSCTCLTDFCVGNLEKTSLQEILDGDEIKKFSNYKVLSDTVCYTCEYKKFCNGGCIGMSYHHYGVLGKGDIRCPKLGVK